ncbi:MAG: major capsid protein [Planctomycetota bacterium]
MAFRLIDAAEQAPSDTIAGIYQTFAETTDLLNAIQFDDAPNGAFTYLRPVDLGNAGFREINQAFGESTGRMEKIREETFPMGGDADVDKKIVDNDGESLRGDQESMKLIAMAHLFDYTFIKGDRSSGDNSFTGLQSRLGEVGAGQHFTNGNGALSFLNLDRVIDSVRGATHLYMSQEMRRLFDNWVHSSQNSTVRHTQGEFRTRVTVYKDLPILEADPNDHTMPPLDFLEAGNTTSIYALNLNPSSGIIALQDTDPDVRDLGEVDDAPVYRSRIDWSVGMALKTQRAAARLSGITNAAI